MACPICVGCNEGEADGEQVLAGVTAEESPVFPLEAPPTQEHNIRQAAQENESIVLLEIEKPVGSTTTALEANDDIPAAKSNTSKEGEKLVEASNSKSTSKEGEKVLEAPNPDSKSDMEATLVPGVSKQSSQESFSTKNISLVKRASSGSLGEVIDLTKNDVLHIIAAFIIPGLFACSPILMPFGTAFAKDGENGILENWAYFFWYNPIGWGAMWIKIVLWNCELWDQPFFIPFMQGRDGIFKLNASLIAVFNNDVFAVVFFIIGYLIFKNPVPIGTISFGVPCFVAMFLNMYFLVVPRQNRASFRDHLRILRCWLPFVIWVIGLCTNIGLIWLQNDAITNIENEFLFVLANVGCVLALILWRELLSSIPLHVFMGDQNMDLAKLWNLGYAAMCSTMTDWLLPGMENNAAGYVSTVLVIAVNFSISCIQYYRAKNVLDLTSVILNNAMDAIAGWAFLWIFAYNAFGPNKHTMYIIRDLDNENAVKALLMILVNFLVNMLKMLLMIRFAPKFFKQEDLREAKMFALQGLRQWYWLVLWLLISTCCACGACMVMTHDGMDCSFVFSEWQGTWPF